MGKVTQTPSELLEIVGASPLKMTEAREEQPPKACLPMERTLAGIVTVAGEVHP